MRPQPLATVEQAVLRQRRWPSGQTPAVLNVSQAQPELHIQ